ncbi:MAG: long-chain fatty acid--CoA ligase [Syntrophomonadaceae bacterium]|jgi:long-chain acyl-CoA synthetase|nr:long-chain fatty acid--CoA ligase [Syntrophomonadaceae bacterium]
MSTVMPWLKHYDLGVPNNYIYKNVPLFEMLEETAQRNPYKTAIIYNDNTIIYEELNRMSDSFALSLQKQGVKAGDRVMLSLPNIPETVIAYYGVLKMGGIVVNSNPLFTEHELEFMLNDSGATRVVTFDFMYQKFAGLMAKTGVEKIIVAPLGDFTPDSDAVILFKDMLKETDKPERPDINPKEDVAILQYTGGTTGNPKGVMLTHYNLIANATQIAGFSRATSEDRFISAIPFFHVYGMTTSMNIPIMYGATFLPYPFPRETEGLIKTIAKYKPTLFYAVPTMYASINAFPGVEKYDLSSIRLCVSGGAALADNIRNTFEEMTGCKMREALGMTEATTGCSCSPCVGMRKEGVGIPFPDEFMATIDPEGNFLPPGHAGELVIKGPNVMKGYWNNPEATKNAFVGDGTWVRTGDVVVMDEDGYFKVIDRLKDVIITSGYNVYSLEVENVLYQHSKVLEAAVIGVPDPVKGEIVKAFIAAKPGEVINEEELLNLCQKLLAPYKVPRLFEFLPELPKSNVGKILKRELR